MDPPPQRDGIPCTTPSSFPVAQEADQHQDTHGQFVTPGSCQTITNGSGLPSWNLTNNSATSILPGGLSLSRSERSPVFRNHAPVSCPLMDGYTQHAGNSAMSANMFCYLSSHLNNIGSKASIIANMRSPDFPSTQEKLGNHNSGIGSIGGSSTHYLSSEISADAIQYWQESSSSAASISPIVQPRSGHLFASTVDDGTEHSSHISSNKKRKWATHPSERQCNCAKTACLKLYCVCFAERFYCGESCNCSNCLNRHENEDKVEEMQNQIESRDSKAFGPKIVTPDTDFLTNTLENGMTPPPARHKRGCNCKKSMCLKKYCDCYKVNVGCFDGCRCESCKNPFGKKPETVYGRLERWTETFDRTAEEQEFQSCGELNNGGANLPALEGHYITSTNPQAGVLDSSESTNSCQFPEVSYAQFSQGNCTQKSAYNFGYMNSHVSGSTCISQHALMEDYNIPDISVSAPPPWDQIQVPRLRFSQCSNFQIKSNLNGSSSDPIPQIKRYHNDGTS